jgi:Amt family ammonium transporter
MVYQMMFAIITPALIIGAFAERMKFSAFLVFSILWATIVYDPMAHWLWGVGGWLRTMGALDFAGGAVVHISAGTGALAAALVIGKRKGYPELSPPHNLPFAVLGAGLLWFGWFGFNGGSALSSGTVAVTAFIATHVAGAVAATAWAVLEWVFGKRPTALGIISGAIAGLATITPAAGYVTPGGAMAIGALAGLVCYISVMVVKNKFGYDDSLDAFGVHGVGGALGVLAVGLFATKAVNAGGANGLFHGGSSLLLRQVIAMAVCVTFSFTVSWILLKLVDRFIGLRVTEHEENVGLDLTQHSESAYTVVG